MSRNALTVKLLLLVVLLATLALTLGTEPWGPN
jgi:hypothetical protein